MENGGITDFKVINDKGKEIVCYVLFTFDSVETGKSYIIYTDNSLDDQGQIQVFASVYKPGSEMELEPIETEREWNIIEIVLNEIQKEVNSKSKSEHTVTESGEPRPVDCSNEEGKDFVRQIMWSILASGSAEETNVKIELLRHAYEQLGDPMGYTSDLKQIGVLAYREGRYEVAEPVFEVLAADGDIDGKNNLAYMIRRRETAQRGRHTLSEAMQLLKDGVQANEQFSLVNMALILALRLGRDSDWLLGDALISQIPMHGIRSVMDWWGMVGGCDEAEGFLVHLWLMRYGKVQASPLGSIEFLANQVKKDIPQAPQWIMELIQ